MNLFFVLVVTVLVSVAAHPYETSSGLRPQSREKRQIGGEELLDPDDPKNKKLAEESYEKYQRHHRDGRLVRQIKVTKATRQLVNGYIYRLTFNVFKTDYLGGSHEIVCNSKVVDDWQNKKEFTVDCGPLEQQSRNEQFMPGGPVDIDPNDPEYKQLAYESYRKYIENNPKDGTKEPISIKIIKATFAIVSGSSKTIDFIVSTWYGSYMVCHSEVWEQSWLNKKDIDVNCRLLETVI